MRAVAYNHLTLVETKPSGNLTSIEIKPSSNIKEDIDS
jgi:hypothetical protein